MDRTSWLAGTGLEILSPEDEVGLGNRLEKGVGSADREELKQGDRDGLETGVLAEGSDEFTNKHGGGLEEADT